IEPSSRTCRHANSPRDRREGEEAKCSEAEPLVDWKKSSAIARVDRPWGICRRIPIKCAWRFVVGRSGFEGGMDQRRFEVCAERLHLLQKLSIAHRVVEKSAFDSMIDRCIGIDIDARRIVVLLASSLL